MTKYKTVRAAKKAWKKAIDDAVKSKGLFQVRMEHDDDCGIYKINMCNCNCTRVLMDEKFNVIKIVEGGGFYDPLENLNQQLSLILSGGNYE